MNLTPNTQQKFWLWKSDFRYYIVRLQFNLFGEYSLIKEWGGIINRLGNTSTETYDTLEQAISEISRVIKIRASKKYNLILTK